jgi:hypothetical protein
MPLTENDRLNINFKRLRRIKSPTIGEGLPLDTGGVCHNANKWTFSTK